MTNNSPRIWTIKVNEETGELSGKAGKLVKVIPLADHDEEMLRQRTRMLVNKRADVILAVKQARAEAYTEAADTFRECGETAVQLAYLDKAKAALS